MFRSFIDLAFVMVSRPHFLTASICARSKIFSVRGFREWFFNSNLAQFRNLDAAIGRLLRAGAVSAVAGSVPDRAADQNPNRQADNAQRNDLLPSDRCDSHVHIISRSGENGCRDSYLARRVRRVPRCLDQARFRAIN